MVRGVQYPILFFSQMCHLAEELLTYRVNIENYCFSLVATVFKLWTTFIEKQLALALFCRKSFGTSIAEKILNTSVTEKLGMNHLV